MKTHLAPTTTPARRARSRWKVAPLNPAETTALQAWQRANYRGVIAVTDGVDVMRLVIAALAERRRSALCLVSTRLALESWCRQLQQAYAGRVGCYGSGVSRMRSVTVSTLAGSASYVDRFADRFDMLVVQDAHTAAAFPETFNKSRAPARLGFTRGPPGHTVGVAHLSQLVGPVVYELRSATHPSGGAQANNS